MEMFFGLLHGGIIGKNRKSAKKCSLLLTYIIIQLYIYTMKNVISHEESVSLFTMDHPLLELVCKKLLVSNPKRIFL
jgi:hypothetical protein